MELSIVHRATPDAVAAQYNFPGRTQPTVCGAHVTPGPALSYAPGGVTCDPCNLGIGHPDVVTRRVDYLVAIRHNDEGAHEAEDALHRDVLRAIAEGRSPDPVRAAAAALASTSVEFSRWYS